MSSRINKKPFLGKSQSNYKCKEKKILKVARKKKKTNYILDIISNDK